MPAPLLVLLAAVCFGTTGTAQAFAPDDASAVSLGSARLVVGGLGLALVSWLIARWQARGDDGAAPAPIPAAPAASVAYRLPTWAVIGVGALGVLAYQPTFFEGARANGVAVGTVLALGSAPLFTGLLEWLWFRRRPTSRWLGATALAVVGVVLLAAGGGSGDGDAGLAGPLASLAAGASYALYAVAVKVLLERGHSSSSAVGWVFGVGGVLALPLLLTTPLAWIATLEGALVLAWLGGVTVIVAYLLYGAGLKHLRAATASTLTLAEPATAALLGLLVLGERLGVLGWCGIAVVVLAVLSLSVAAPRASRVPPPDPRTPR